MVHKIRKENGFIIREPLVKFDNGTKDEAMAVYMALVKEGVLLSNYEDLKWVLFDEKKKTSVNFSRREIEMKEILKDKDISYEEIIDDLKVFVLLRLGTVSLESLRTFTAFCIDEIIDSKYFISCSFPAKERSLSDIRYYMEFARLLNASESYLEDCEMKLKTARDKSASNKANVKHPCSLNEFVSYFIFDDVFRGWWETANKEKRLEFYPLYLFWVITTILPLRVTEFCVTPYNCIRKDSGRFYLTVRRTRLKGSPNAYFRYHGYKLDKDYYKDEYEIPEWLYECIKDYISSTEKGNRVKKTELFLRSINDDSTMPFSREELNDLLDKFYDEVLVGEKNYIIVDEETLLKRYFNEELGTYEMKENEIMRLLPKHTRHLAMINLVLRGCNPMIVKEFAGHSFDSTSANYYANISKTVRCRTKMLRDRLKSKGQRTTIIEPESVLVDEAKEYINLDNGKCYSSEFMKGNSKDCIRCGGECIRCEFYVPNKKDGLSIDTKALDEEFEFIAKILRSPELDERMTEYQIRLQNMQKNLENYSLYCWRLMEGGEEDGSKSQI